MLTKPSNHISSRLEGWAPTAEAQMVIFWRIIHMYMARYGSIPLGQMLVELTTIVLNELGRPPTVTDLCEATGLPKSSISRYISSQMTLGMIAEVIDPNDRRRRKLVLTDKGLEERRWQIKTVRKLLDDVRSWDEKNQTARQKLDPDLEFERMKIAVASAPDMIGKKRKKRRVV
ncbi:MAG: MarR family winged helix-turn-helix transcriptional regulator [Gammaproteobacteria bacterium]|nr:MarR family winged helix-turn-helix transcriptional regulator [Gammaproteobacteria bacterium]NND37429.1 winged helix-turn-helix transcriptional regulator [Gammaproteobacteria bacterium]